MRFIRTATPPPAGGIPAALGKDVWIGRPAAYARTFNGSTDTANFGSISTVLPTSYAVFVRIRPSAISAGSFTFFTLGVAGVGNWQLIFRRDADTLNVYHAIAGGGFVNATEAAALAVNRWTNVGMVWDGATVFLFHNGRIPNSVAANSAKNALDTANAIGWQRSNGNQWWGGDIADAAIWIPAISPQAMLEITSGLHPLNVGKERISYWSLGASGTLTEPDEGGGRYPLTITGTTVTSPPPPLRILARARIAAGAAGVTTPVSFSDLGTGVDAVTLVALLQGAEAGSATDAATLAALLLAAEAGTGVDAATLLASLLAADSGSGLDSFTTANPVTVGDTGTSTDAFSAIVQIIAAESGVGVEQILAPLAKITASDSATGSEVWTPSPAQVQMSDVGLGSDLFAAIQGMILGTIRTGRTVTTSPGKVATAIRGAVKKRVV